MKTFSRNPDGDGMHHVVDAETAAWADRVGTFTLEPPESIVAGAPVCLAFRFSCGEQGLAEGDTLALAWRLPCDWDAPQFDDPMAPNFATAHPPEHVGLRLAYHPRGGIKPWHHLFTATLARGTLERGDQIRFVLGDRSGGSVGWTCQRSSATQHRFVAMVRRRSARHWQEIPGPDPIEVASGRAHSLSILAPSDGRCDEPLHLIVRLADAYGNPSLGSPDGIHLDAPGLEVRSMHRIRRHGRSLDLWAVVASFPRPGRYRIEATVPALSLAARSNPVDLHVREPESRLLWGDLHAGQSDLGCGQGTVEAFFWYARHVAGLQFASHQPNDVYVTRDDWNHARRVTEAAHDPGGGFVSFHGCEWTALPPKGGDRNVFYRNDQPALHRADRWYHEAQPDTWTDARDPEELYACLKGTDARINLHAGGYTSDLSWHDPGLEGLVEIHSTHGTSDWLVEAALEQGRTFGISGGTDGISGRPGACVPGTRQTRNVPNGCFGVYAPELTRDHLWQAIAERRCYATDGARIRLDVRIGDARMGEALTATTLPPLRVDVAGTAAIERVLVRRDGIVVHSHEASAPDAEHPFRYRVHWHGTRSHGSSHAQALAWRGHLRPATGSLDLVAPYGFYCAEDALASEGGAIHFRSTTAGNSAGFVFDAEDGPGARLAFQSNLVAADLPWPDASTSTVALPPEMGVGHVGICRAPSEDGARDLGLEIPLEHAALEGRHAYWVEVIQIDGRRAWSSPVYVTAA